VTRSRMLKWVENGGGRADVSEEHGRKVLPDGEKTKSWFQNALKKGFEEKRGLGGVVPLG